MECKPSDKPKPKHKKGLWSPDEDQKLKDYIVNHGHGSWSSIPINAGLQRNGKSCRLRWINYLRPGLKRGAFSVAEEKIIVSLHQTLGNKWSQISHHLPGRTDNEIKNHWHSYLKKKMTRDEISTNIGEKISELLHDEATTQNSSFESFFGNIDQGCYTAHDQSTKQVIHDSKKITTLLPKLFFAEWLSLDQFQGQKLGISSDNNNNNNNNNISEDQFKNKISTTSTSTSFNDDKLQSYSSNSSSDSLLMMNEGRSSSPLVGHVETNYYSKSSNMIINSLDHDHMLIRSPFSCSTFEEDLINIFETDGLINYDCFPAEFCDGIMNNIYDRDEGRI